MQTGVAPAKTRKSHRGRLTNRTDKKVEVIVVDTDAAGVPTVSNKHCHLSKSNFDVVVWVTNAEGFEISFDKDGSPFDDTFYYLPPQGAVAAGPVRQGAGPGECYNYSITSVSTGKTLDPEMAVDK